MRSVVVVKKKRGREKRRDLKCKMCYCVIRYCRGLQKFDKHCEITDKPRILIDRIDKPQQRPRGFVKSNWKCKGPTCRDGHVQLHAAVVAGLVEVVQVLARYRMRRGETGPGLLGPPLAFGVRLSPHSLSWVN